METSFLELKQKEVVNLCDGKRLGKVCDLVFSYPEGRVQGIVVPGGRGFRWGKADLFIELKNVTKIGIDVVLVDIKAAPKPPEKHKGRCRDVRYCPPSPPPTPQPREDPPPFYRGDRRDYGEYE